MADLASAVLLIAGAFVLLLSILAFARFPDAASRIHAAGLAGSIGFPLVVLGLMVRADGVGAVLLYAAILVLGSLASASVAQGVAWALRHRLGVMRSAHSARQGHSADAAREGRRQ